MRAILGFLASLFLLISLYVTNDLLEQYKFNHLLYKDRTAAALNFTNYEGNPNDLLESYAERYDLEISKYVFVNQDTIRIFTTDPSLGSRIDRIDGDFPNKGTAQFITNRLNNSSNDKSGSFHSGESTIAISIWNLDNQKQASASGIYYIDDKDGSVSVMLDQLQKDGVSSELIEARIDPVVISQPLTFLISPLIILLSMIGVISFYLINRSDHIMLYKVMGYSYIRISFILVKKLISPLGAAVLTSYILYLIFRIVTKKEILNLVDFTLLYAGLAVVLFVGIVLYTFLLIGLIFFFGKEYEALKGKRLYKTLMALSYVMKILFLIAAVGALSQLDQTKKSLEEYQNNLETWNQTENLYQTVLYSTGQVDLAIESGQNNNLKQVYNQLNNELNGFLIDAGNYEISSNGSYLYEMNTDDQNASTSPYGKAITINENYLEFNKIRAETGEIEGSIVSDPSVTNLLVPAALKDKEDEIKKNFLDYFYFQKVEVGNIYREAKGQELDDSPKNDLSINIIYVRDNQEYFTYNPANKGEGDYFIKDPIAILDTGQFDASYYMSYLSRAYFFYSDQSEPTQKLEEIAGEHDVTSQINSVISVFDEYGQKIQELKTDNYLLLLAIILLYIATFTTSVYFTICHFYNYKMEVLLKNIHGYSYFRTNRTLLLLQFLSYCILLIGILFVSLPSLIIIVFGGILIDALLVIGLSKYYTANMHTKLRREA
ncbi:hypothetical protein [Terribacillus sp. JSM ZJ617]|uniref:hypothetical protein n=1 Tax=Terribacillus sp. JSM ZJ617 TaxID=3342119 RepID=UPI0035A8E3A8